MINLPLNWDALGEKYQWVRDLITCDQDPVHHAEGSVYKHTRMVCDAMEELSSPYHSIFMPAALLHDIAKPACFGVDENGRITAKNHAPKGAIMARQILWTMGYPFKDREYICNLVRFHMKPHHFFDKNPNKTAIEIALSVTCEDLALLSEADNKGRISVNRDDAIVNLEMFREHCREMGCYKDAFPFASDHARYKYFNGGGNWHETNEAYDDTVCEVIMMSGLPASGKDHWIKTNVPDWPVISLDELRKELGVSPVGDQSAVVNRAKEMAKQFLLDKKSFVYNATNLSKDLRRKSLDVFKAYNAKIRIEYIETPRECLFKRNAARAKPVPESAILDMMNRWEMPSLTEAHVVNYNINGGIE